MYEQVTPWNPSAVAHVRVEGRIDPAEAARRATPRDDIIREREVAPGRFEADVGPFRQYERRFEVLADGTVRDQTTFVLDIGIWGVLFTPPMRGMLARRPAEASNPWWAPPDRLDARAARVLTILTILSLALGYLGTLLTQTITFAVDEFGASNSAQGDTLAAVRIGILLAVVITSAADRRGRRKALLFSALGSCVLTIACVFAPNLLVLGGLQTLSRGCASAMGILIAVTAAEEMPAGSRAYAVSLLAMCTGLGAGLALVLLPLADLGDAAWRILYAVPLLFIPAIIRVGRALPESRRFRARHDEDASLAGHGRRFWLLAASAFLASIFIAPASQFLNDFLRDEQGYSAGQISAFSLITNLPGGAGIIIAGRLADVRGRRIVGAVGMFGGVGFTLLMYLGSGASIWVWSILGAFIGAATVPALGVYGPELFPTAVRGKANAVISIVGVVGSATGLIFAGRLSERFDAFGPALALLAIGPAVLTVLILTAYPETARKELETINPEDQADPTEPSPSSTIES